MFSNACKIFFDLHCSVGGGSKGDKGKLHGTGCLLGPKHVITARHIWSNIKKIYQYPSILKYDGIFKCKIVLESKEFDIVILETEEIIENYDFPAPSVYPKIYSKIPSRGLLVGFSTTLRLNETEKPESHTAFFQAHVSMQLHEHDFVLSNGVIQKGSSGSPVFTPSAELVGILIQNLQFSVDTGLLADQIITTPVFSPLLPFKKIIENLVLKTVERSR
ncbi:MAG: trypsin-like peptidase domain-containing protein [Candidatus Omnitrophica bacterium]|nr:trypsin-like peptidase domain-containing protein [Candidatus Omnitrophota bacterium]